MSSKVNDHMDDLEFELKFLETDKYHRSLKDVIESILAYDKERKKHFAEG